jgi:NAD(P)-dependent dehydrogenase (short-subunit alcohol dehydrogenase family)
MAEHPIALIVGANRGIGLGVVREFLARGWDVIATARRPEQAQELAALAQTHRDRVAIHGLEMNDPTQLDGLIRGLAGRVLDIALINAGIAGPAHRSASEATAEEIGALMVTNAIAPIRLARQLAPLLRADKGVLAFTSSVMGSVALNTGGHELYRASKAALNSLSRGLWGELSGRGLTLLTLHPGWVRTDMGGPGAAVSVADSARGMVDVMLAERGGRHHAFFDYTGQSIAW